LRLRPFASLATGIYVDQRGTRTWLRERCAGKRVLNLFAYTGLFSVSLLAGGAERAHDVDLSAPALRRALETAQRNAVAERYAQTHGDCMTYLRRDRDEWDILIVDPPTAAQGADGWASLRDYPALLALALPRLAPGGLLIACSNTIGKPIPLDRIVADAARAAGLRINAVELPPLAGDVPQLAGFPEGRPYRITAVQRPG
ncbi:MAG: class I SAM-dependent methyltransferase, partial [Planctomycetes bacterium]|nr:class I SAM-dependent methyltransferase [Planctomycetota bacterium]